MASVILSFGGKEVKTYELSKPATVVGRDPGADIVIDNLGVSRSHCQLLQRGGHFVVQDMNSANGTYVNGKRVGEQSLNDADQIVVGKYIMTFRAEKEAAAAAAGAPRQVTTAPAADRVIPDSLNTYMMDGDKIKERLEEMRRAEQSKSAPAAQEAPGKRGAAPPVAAPPAPAPQAPAEAKPERVERHTRITMASTARGEGGSFKRLLYFSWALIAVLIIAFAILFFFFLRNV
jgi:pSer/pThr/pTyr-binding forkhead associated (FHA) protein